MKICAVIPAAGLGSRLGTTTPKILTAITKSETIWSILRKKLLLWVDHIHIIVSPTHQSLIHHALKNDIENGLVTLGLQPKPIGMGDAIFCGYSVWSKADILLIVWGDQVHISEDTLKRSLTAHSELPKTIALPLTRLHTPYVEYVFNHSSKLTHILQSREGDHCHPQGWSDVGTFVLSVENLLSEWHTYLTKNIYGNATKEINFLPFLPFLIARQWSLQKVEVTDTREARGINTKEDLLFFQSVYGEFTS